jgi:uncharacterized damage-inducible protein DinB
MTLDEIRTVIEFNYWGNHRALDACAGLTPEQFTRDLGNSFPSVRDTLAHILGAEWIWHERWHGRSPTALPKPTDYPDFATLRARWSEVESDIRTFIGALDEARLARVHEYRLVSGAGSAQPLWQLIQHLVNHGSYHRGQITMMLRILGAKPAGTDLITFYRERPAAAVR